MISLEDNNTSLDNSHLPLNELGALKNMQGSERASTPVPLAVAELVTAMPEGTNGTTFSLTNITLHSPSTIIGTPSDPSSRFEYPFPSPQLESEPRSSLFYPSKPSNPPPVGPEVSVRQRQSFVHPKLEVQAVPVPPTLTKRVLIELRFPRLLEGVDVLGQAQAPIKRRTNVNDPVKTS